MSEIIGSHLQPVIIEVDHKTHYSDAATHKDIVRDLHFLKKGIPTIRFKLKDIIGNKPWSDKVILSLIDAEIEYQLRGGTRIKKVKDILDG